MSRFRFATALIAVLALTACNESDSTGPSSPGTHDTPVPDGPRNPGPGGSSGGGDTTTTNPGDTTTTNPADTTGAGDPVTNGIWTNPDSTTIQPVDPTSLRSDGERTAGTSGTSTALIFKTSGSGLYGVGTCGPNGMWTDPAGNVFGPNNPNCIDYGSTGPATTARARALRPDRAAWTVAQSGRPSDAPVPHQVRPHRCSTTSRSR